MSDDAEPLEDQTIYLVPVRSLRRRAIVVAGLWLLALIGTTSWSQKLFFCACMALWIGSFPQARLSGGRFERELYVAFVRVRTKRWKLDRFCRIEIGPDEHSETGPVGVLLAPFFWFLPVIDAIVPWLGGDYKVWLRAHSGRRVLVWQGNSDEYYKANLAALRQVTGLPVGGL